MAKKHNRDVRETAEDNVDTRLPRLRAEKYAPAITDREIHKVFATPEAWEILEVQRDIAAFGSLVRESRRLANLTQAALAEKSGVSRATIAGIEAGCQDGGPRLETVAILVRACGRRLLPSYAELSRPAAAPVVVR